MAGTNRLRVSALVLANVLALLVGCALFTSGVHPAHAQTPQRFVPGEVLVKFEPGASGQERAEAHRQNDAEVEEIIPDIGVRVVDVPVGREQSAVAAYERNPNVSYAELNTIIRIADQCPPNDPNAPNDPKVCEQWQYNNTAEIIAVTKRGKEIRGKDDADIDAFEAWQVTEGSSDVNIAILDTGINAGHQDLLGKVVQAHNFTTSKKIGDKNGHGTHVSGSAAAVTNNGVGVAGTCPKCSLYNVKVVGKNGSGKLSWLVKGINWAADNGAEVISMSLTSTSGSRALSDSVNNAWQKGVVLVAAAGNYNSKKAFYPAYYDHVIAVASTDYNDLKAPSSNYGDWVDVAAPGVTILSTLPGNRYGFMSGTSMATPHVAGLAGLVWAEIETSGVDNLCGAIVSTNECVRERIESTADQIPGTGTLWVHGRINANDAVTPSPPSTP